MALLVCPECGGCVSEFANACPHCGCPIAYVKGLDNKQKEISFKAINNSVKGNNCLPKNHDVCIDEDDDFSLSDYYGGMPCDGDGDYDNQNYD